MEHLSKEFWDERYRESDTGWNLRAISTPLKDYVDQLKDKNLRILIPGCGNSYEAEYLHELGFGNVHVIDISELPLMNFQERVPSFPSAHLHFEDFFLHQGTYDLILEQTFFCAIDPSLRDEYVRKMAELLAPGGKLVGVLFDQVPGDPPPYGGDEEEYRARFEPHFASVKIERCHNSIPPRQGRELFIRMEMA